MQLRAFVAALVVTALVAGCTAKASGYPDQYLLKADELPDGLKLSEVPEEMAQFGFHENPAEIPAQFLSGLGEEFKAFAPEKVWLELIEKTSSGSEFGADGGLMIAAGFWTDEAKAKSAIDEIRSQSDGDPCTEVGDAGAMLRDKNVVVIIGGDESMQEWVPKVVDALEKKAHGLENVC